MKDNSSNNNRNVKTKSNNIKNRYENERENELKSSNSIIHARLINKEIGKEILISKPITLIGSNDSCDFIIKVRNLFVILRIYLYLLSIAQLK